MKTKKFRIATAGSTVDGRTIDAGMLQEMAEGYNPSTYGARLNVEHIRGMVPGSVFGAYGDVLELSTEEVEVDFHGETEKRLALFGVFDITGEAKELNGKGQKLYPSIEIDPNFAGKGKAYLMGVALTDSPASLATERMQFNRQLPDTLRLGVDEADLAFALEFAEAEGEPTGEAAGFLSKFGTMLDGFAAKITGQPGTVETPPAGTGEGEEGADLDFSQLRPLFDEFGQTVAGEMTALRTAMADQADQFALQIKALEQRFEAEPDNRHTARPPATGANGSVELTDC